MIVVVLGIMAMVGVETFSNPHPELSIPSQAEKLASSLRFLQTQANASGKAMGLTVAVNGKSYSYGECTNSACDNAPKSTLVNIEFKEFDILLSGTPATIYFDTLGRPSAAATYVFKITASGSALGRVCVETVTGYVRVKDKNDPTACS